MPSAAGGVDLDASSSSGCSRSSSPGMSNSLFAGQAKRLPGLAGGEFQRQDAHAHQIAAVDALEARRRSRPARRAGSVPLAAQSRLLPVPYSVPARTTSGTPSALYFIAAS